jgi:integrase-like protein
MIETAVRAENMSGLTYNQYEGALRLHLAPFFGRYALAAIDVALINRYISEKLKAGLHERTVKNSLTPLCGILTDAQTEGLIPSNPLRSPKRGRHGNRHVGVVALRDDRRATPKHLEITDALALLGATPQLHPT